MTLDPFALARFAVIPNYGLLDTRKFLDDLRGERSCCCCRGGKKKRKKLTGLFPIKRLIMGVFVAARVI